MADKVLLAGAGGQLGSRLQDELKTRGYLVRALTRGTRRSGASGADVVSGGADEVFVADARDRAALKGACEGVSSVVSALGASLRLGRTKGGGTYGEVDHAANKNLLAEAVAAGAQKFVYVSVAGAERLRGTAYVDAHEEFVRELERSGLDYTVVRPTGFFYVFAEIFKMAARGRAAIVGRGDARTNPVDERDVARVCADALASDEREIVIGGPEVYTRREIVELAFAALGRRPKITSVPAGLMRALVRPVRLVDRRLWELLEFGIVVGTVDVVAPTTGTHSLRDYFQQLAETVAPARGK